MCQDLGKCIGQSGLTLLIKDSSRADIGGCSMAQRHIKTSRAACGSSPYNEGHVMPAASAWQVQQRRAAHLAAACPGVPRAPSSQGSPLRPALSPGAAL